MKRNVIDELIKWNNSNHRKPLLLTGAKGVGKTYLAYDFARAFFEQISYLNFEREPILSMLIQSSDQNTFTDLLIHHLKVEDHTVLKNNGVNNEHSEDEIGSIMASSDGRILILDEIGYYPDIEKILQQLIKSKLYTKIIAISSKPLSKKELNTFHVIKVHPLEFDEFLRATNNDWYIEAIINHYKSNKKIPEIVHKELLAIFQTYLQVGGMPGIINEYLQFMSVINIPEQQSQLTGSYHDYIIRENPDSEALKMNQVYDSITLQLAKENKKFQYKLIRKGTTHSMYKDAIQRLAEHDYVIRCNKITTEQLLKPIEQWASNEANSNFKLYLQDTGFLYSKMAEDKDLSSDQNCNRALLENYVAQSLNTKGYLFAFWESDSMAKIDFVIYKDRSLLPIEIHCTSNTRSKSIHVFKQKIDVPYAVKISSKNFDYSNNIKYVPYYAVFCL